MDRLLETDQDVSWLDRVLFDVPIDGLPRGSNCRANGQQRICLNWVRMPADW
jgi:hypothetical protein